MQTTSVPLLQTFPEFSPKLYPIRQHMIHRIPKPPSILSFPVPPPVPCLRMICASPGSDDATPPSYPDDVVSSMVEELLRKEENRGLLEGLDAASQRVDRAKAALAEIERQETDARRAKVYKRRIEKKEAEIAESQRELSEARAMVEEAQRSLSLDENESSSGYTCNEDINKDVERWESVKTALVSSIAGTLTSLPIYLYQSTSSGQLILQLITIVISCALFGVTFRYAVRRDLDNIQLKTGTCAAFGFVRGLAALSSGEPLEPNVGSFISHSINGTVYAAENIFVFLSAAIALDFCFKMRLLSPFPARK